MGRISSFAGSPRPDRGGFLLEERTLPVDDITSGLRLRRGVGHEGRATYTGTPPLLPSGFPGLLPVRPVGWFAPVNTTPIIEGAAELSSAAKDTDALVIVAAPPEEGAGGAGPAAGVEARGGSRTLRGYGLAEGSPGPTVVAVPSAPGGRIVVTPTAPIVNDTDDCRVLSEASASAVARAVQAGASHPLLAVAVPKEPRFARALEVCALSSAATAWEPLEARGSLRRARRRPPNSASSRC